MGQTTRPTQPSILLTGNRGLQLHELWGWKTIKWQTKAGQSLSVGLGCGLSCTPALCRTATLQLQYATCGTIYVPFALIRKIVFTAKRQANELLVLTAYQQFAVRRSR